MFVTGPVVKEEVLPQEKRPELERTRVLQRIRSKEVTQQAQDIGEIPVIKDPERRREAASSFQRFCEIYHSQTYVLPWCADHILMISKVEEAIRDGGLFAVALPRGAGKTSLVESAASWGMLNGFRDFSVVVGSDAVSATMLLRSVKNDLETNELLAEDYPEVLSPIRALDGSTLRCKGQTYRKVRTRSEWGPRVIVLPTVRPDWEDIEQYAEFLRPDLHSLSSGFILRVVGLTGGIRGMKHRKSDGTSVRPSLVICDDPQTDESARSPAQCQKRERIISSTVLGLAGPGNKIAGIMPCTVIAQGDLADNVLDRRLHPEWQGVRCRLVIDFPSNMKLWDEYKELRIESQQKEEGPDKANAWYLEHREEMDAGSRVAWPERFNHDEVSAIQHAMHLLFDRGDNSFWSEMQNQPISELDLGADDLTSDQVMAKVNKHVRNTIPIDSEFLTCGIDVQANLLYFVIAAWSSDFTGHIINYSTFPEQHLQYFTLANAPHTIPKVIKAQDLEGRLFGALDTLVTNLMTREFTRDDGSIMRIERMCIDSNWGQSTPTIYKWCRQSPFTGILPSHGKFVSASGRPMAEWAKRPGDRNGLNWKIRSMESRRSVRSIVFDTNFWKTFVHTRFKVPLGSKSCLDIFGEKPELHRLYADHLCKSEYKIPIENKTSGRVIDEWKGRPERNDGHWLDATVLCAVGASTLGVVVKENPRGEVEAKPRRVSFRELQEKKAAPEVKPNRVSFKELQQKNQNPPPR